MTTLYTLNVENYAPEITELTYPLLKRYADKIGAEFHIIASRRWPEMPPVYEKLQIYDLSRERGDDWSLYIDSDAVVHPDLFNVTEMVRKDTVLHNGADMASCRWTYDDYFRRDGRNIGSCNWFTLASSWCRDLWTPLDLSLAEAVSRIHPIVDEIRTGITPEHLIDDYTLSRNIARFGLKFTTMGKVMEALGDTGNYLWHQYTIPAPEKVKQIKELLTKWRLD